MSNPSIGSMSVHELQERFLQKSPLFLLDVRTEGEVALCQLPHAVTIPLSEIESHLDVVPKDCDIVVYCHHGIRSKAVCQYLYSRGWEPHRLFNLEGGIDAFSHYVDPTLARY